MNPFRRRRRAEPPNSTHTPGEEPSEAGPSDSVAGERGVGFIHRPPSLQSRISNLLALALLASLGVGFLGWYYGHAMANRTAAKSTARTASKNTASGEMTLPPLGRIDPPRPTEYGSSSPGLIEGAMGPAPPEPPRFDDPRTASGSQPMYGAYSSGQPPPKTPAQLALERQLAGPVFTGPSTSLAGAAEASAGPADAAPRAVPAAGTERSGETGDLTSLLKPRAIAASEAQLLPTQRLLLPQGAFLDCTLETAIDSTLPGMTTCVLATDTFSADGSVVLLERGTKLVGETRGQVSEGAARLFVLWTQARTPTGVVVPLASPGADELGRAGLSGEVNRHFWQRFGAAILVTVIDGAVQAAVQSRSSGGTVIYNPSSTTDVTTEVLKSTIAIPPTITKANGDRIQVFVARDLDFRSVYELRPTSAAR